MITNLLEITSYVLIVIRVSC